MKSAAIPLALLALGSAAMAEDITILRAAARSSEPVSTDNFTGSARVERLIDASAPARATTALVTFEAGARTDWHTHPLGQTLIVMSGTGRVQAWGDSIQEIRAGDTVRIPPNVKHWHGASPQSGMAHLAVGEPLDGKSVAWMEKVTDAQFNAPVLGAAPPAPEPGPTRAQMLNGEFSPKLAELTDKVLYGDIWARPQLSPRDRSLVTVAALVAMDRPDQLRSHLQRARDNGLTEAELAEAITHLAFYAGWPNAVSAVAVARELFGK
jgi:4-carboxymuconolactone decarboxylase